MRKILEWAKAGIAGVAIATILGSAAWGLRTVARWLGTALLRHVFLGHAAGWLGETVY